MCSIEGTTDPYVDIGKFCLYNKHRGPDDTNTYVSRGIQLGHNLLKIQPNQENIPQPFITEKGNVLTYNGEIYGLGDDTFDVEWLANKIENEGIESLAKDVNGMWAFAWYDATEHSVTLCRDHFGTKPLYYVHSTVKGKDQLYFSSTILPLLITIFDLNGGKNKLDDNLGIMIIQANSGFNVGEKTIFNGIKRVAAGQIIKFKLGNEFEITTNNLWKLDKDFNLFPNYMWNPDEWEHITKKAIKEVCHAPGIKKTVSLSGGLDSSLILDVAKKEDNISASSIGWEGVMIGEKDPERHLLKQIEYATETARKSAVTHHRFRVDHSMKEDKSINDEVFKAMNFIPAWDNQRLIPRFVNITQARAKGAKVYITGDCADEILTGYNGDYNKWCDKRSHTRETEYRKNPVAKFSWYINYDNWNKLIGFYKDNIKSDNLKKKKEHHEALLFVELSKIFNPDIFSVDPIINANFVNLIKHCDGFCTVIDSMCGYYGMESRLPFLHQEWVKYALKIPGQEKLRVPWPKDKKDYKEKKNHQHFLLGHYKGLFREYFDGHYTDNVRYGYRKVGFSNPWNSRNTDINNNLIKDGISRQLKESVNFLRKLDTNELKSRNNLRDFLKINFNVDFYYKKKENNILNEVIEDNIDEDL